MKLSLTLAFVILSCPLAAAPRPKAVKAQAAKAPAAKAPAVTEPAASAPEPLLLKLARQKVEKVKALVESGVLPRVELAQAERAYANAKDDEYLRKTLYGPDLTPTAAQEMLALTARRIEEHKAEVESTKKLVDQQILPAKELEAAQDTLARAEQEHEWAQTRAHVVEELAAMALTEQEYMRAETSGAHLPFSGLVEHYPGSGIFTAVDRVRVASAFEARFRKALPVSADGETAVHRSLGFDHRGRVDVALMPDSAEGLWLRDYLTSHRIPFFAFRTAVAGSATGAHIHIGPPSNKLELVRQSPRRAVGG